VKAFLIGSLTAFLAASSLVHGAVISTSLGNTGSGFANGSIQSTVHANGAQAGQPAPFNATCGTAAIANESCMASWTFNYSVAGQIVTGATLTLGIWGIDSSAALDSVASYDLAGGDDLTALLNTAANAEHGGTGSVRNEYDILSVTIPSTSFTLLDNGTATISLALQGPGLGVINPPPPSIAADLIFSTLDLQTTPVTTTPEPSSFLLLLGGLGAMILARGFRKQFMPGIAKQSL
jgi:hypothetical protein